MNCHICQETLLENGGLSAEARRHLACCQDCQRFAATLAWAVPPRPAPELDSRVLSACGGVLAACRQLRRQRKVSRLLAGIAAAVLVMLSVAVLETPKVANPAMRRLAPADGGEYTEALSWDVGVTLSSAELDQVEMDLELLIAGL